MVLSRHEDIGTLYHALACSVSLSLLLLVLVLPSTYTLTLLLLLLLNTGEIASVSSTARGAAADGFTDPEVNAY